MPAGILPEAVERSTYGERRANEKPPRQAEAKRSNGRI